MNDLISIVVPVYNVEKYLKKCVDSILCQTYSNLEIILVDDGSTDLSGDMCDDLAKKDNRIKVIHKQNGGLSDARNKGIEMASGAFICFFDSDDWVESSVIEKAHSALTKSCADVAIWGFYKDFVDDNDSISKQVTLSCDNYICQKSDFEYLANSDILSMIGYAWNKMYSLSFLRKGNFRFEKGVSLVEDMLFNSEVLSASEKTMFLDLIGNHYIQRNRETLGTKFYPDYYELKIRACKAAEKLLCSYGADGNTAREIMLDNYFAAIKSSCRMASKCSTLNKKEKRAYMKSVFSSDITKSTLNNYSAKGKDVLFKFAIKSKQCWIFERLYG